MDDNVRDRDRSLDPAAILEEALRRRADERDAYLQAECAGFPEMLDDLRGLLAAHDRFPDALVLEAPRVHGKVPPARIGPYAIDEEIGRGGMGVVYRGEDPRLRRTVAIKLLPEGLADRPDLRDRLQREARLLAALNHPAIATIHSLEDADGTHFLTMEYISGESLAERLARASAAPLEIAETVAIAAQITGALEAAHARGIVHRDLKPANVMVLGEGRVKVLDFGLAVQLRDGIGGARGEIAGTPGYMSPEQASGQDVDVRADLYALGRILSECLAATRDPSPGVSDAAGALASLRALAARCASQDRNARPASATDVRRELDEAQASMRMGGDPPARLGDHDATWDASTNIRFPSNRFVGRVRELERIAAGVLDARLLTITGPGGSGKTRLAVEAARRLRGAAFRDGVWFVDLGLLPPATDPAAAVLAVLPWRQPVGMDGPASPGTLLAGREVLLVLDNCEHLLRACGALVTSILHDAPGTRILVTSRSPLGIGGETVLRLGTLAVPTIAADREVESVSEIESVALLLDRVRRADPGFTLERSQVDALCAICRGLDGLPLAIELAAARIAALSAREVESRLAARLSFFRDPARPREAHRTLQSLVDWSYGMLSAEEQALLQVLSLFPGGWTQEAAEAMATSAGIDGWKIFDLHESLVDKSLIERDTVGRIPGDPARYRMLETVRAFAADRLASSLLRRQARAAFLAHHVRWAEDAEPRVTGPDQGRYLRLLRREQENLAAALDAAEEEPSDPASALRIASAIGRFWLLEGRWNEGLGRLRRWIEDPGAAGVDPPTIARANHWAANLAERTGSLVAAEVFARRSLAIWQELGRRSDQARILQNLGNLAYRRGDPATAVEHYRAALAIHRSLGEDLDVAHTLNNLGSVQAAGGDFAAARVSLEESLSVKKRVEDHAGVASTLQNLGALAGLQGDLASAAAFLGEAERICRRIGAASSLLLALGNLALVERMRADYSACRAHVREAIALCAGIDDDATACSLIEVFAMADVQEGAMERAAALLGFARSLGAAGRDASVFEDAGDVAAAIAAARGALGEHVFAAAWARGQAMTLDEAAALLRVDV